MLHHQLRFSPLMLPVSSLWISMIAVQSVSALEAYSSRLFTGTITVEVEMIIRDCSVAGTELYNLRVVSCQPLSVEIAPNDLPD